MQINAPKAIWPFYHIRKVIKLLQQIHFGDRASYHLLNMIRCMFNSTLTSFNKFLFIRNVLFIFL